MSGAETPDPALLERQNRTLQKKLARAERKLETLEILQEQNANLMRALMADLDEERSESERLLLNILLIFGVLASLGAVLTLPGIAGIVLTIGMSVDANVLIFERIREELEGQRRQRYWLIVAMTALLAGTLVLTLQGNALIGGGLLVAGALGVFAGRPGA